MTHNSEHYP